MALVTKNSGKVTGKLDDSPFGRIAALMEPSGAAFKIVQSPNALIRNRLKDVAWPLRSVHSHQAPMPLSL